MAKAAKYPPAQRWALFGAWILGSAAFYIVSLTRLIELSLSNSDATHLILIPFIAAWLMYLERQKIFRTVSFDLLVGFLLSTLGIGLAVAIATKGKHLSPDMRLSANIAAILVIWIAGFALVFGRAAFKAARFPLLFMVLMIPPPELFLHKVIYLLQAGSADITGALFDLFGVPALRDGFVFHLARVNIEIARECSGIRSSIALLILALPVVHFKMRHFWKKSVFLACALAMMILKNGIRVVTLTLLAIYVDPSFLYGRLHHEGGVVFFLLGLLLLFPVYLVLKDPDQNKTLASEENLAPSRD